MLSLEFRLDQATPVPFSTNSIATFPHRSSLIIQTSTAFTLSFVLSFTQTLSEHMNAQLIILITILLAVFVILLGYATWRIRHRQPYLTVGDNPMMSPFSDEQKQHMRQLRARNRDALREVAGIGGVYG